MTVSFGCDRDFYMKPNNGGKRVDYVLRHGDIFTFTENINKRYKHTVPKRIRLKDDRISILFFLKSTTKA
jgi:alkylated DNA repair dioxygenase AlkB